jgi:hypothetical protein
LFFPLNTLVHRWVCSEICHFPEVPHRRPIKMSWVYYHCTVSFRWHAVPDYLTPFPRLPSQDRCNRSHQRLFVGVALYTCQYIHIYICNTTVSEFLWYD